MCVLAHDRTTMDPKRDHGYVVTQIRGPVVTVGPRTGRRMVNRSAVHLEDPQTDWEELNPRISAQQQRKTKEWLLVASKVGEYVNDRITELKDPAYKPSRQVHISREPVITHHKAVSSQR